ncbi:ATP-binding protein involved in chromosome partitioning [Angomonas deanei]|nr:ATP-binding protein involved in chromosome partitioning [Angomonas deanei]|eukprot:EPY39392.1 ATP-binding protein involved in chromosome partitioning [Angomonas deanei]
MSTTIEQIRAILHSIKDHNGIDILNKYSKVLIDVNEGLVIINLELNYPVNQSIDVLMKEKIVHALESIGVLKVYINITWQVMTHVTSNLLKSYTGVKNIIAVVSGKGGVGKSTVSANLAYSLYLLGARVGIVDADIYGPSIPIIMGVSDQPEIIEHDRMVPIIKHGIQLNSLGFLLDYDSPAVLRGPMITKIFEQLVSKTKWCDLDYLIVDMPPGTGDIALSLAKNVPVVGTVIVTTPQDVSLMDVRRCIKMYKKVGTRILGIIENMSSYVCPHCMNGSNLFGSGGGKRISAQYDVPLLGELPFDNYIRSQSDIGEFLIFNNPLTKYC